MTDSSLSASPTARRLVVRSKGFEDAAASVQAALEQLRRAEDTLEQQLADLRLYLRGNVAAAPITH